MIETILGILGAIVIINVIVTIKLAKEVRRNDTMLFMLSDIIIKDKMSDLAKRLSDKLGKKGKK